MNTKDTTDQEFEDYVKLLSDDIDEVTTCLAESDKEGKQHGIVLTIAGRDIVLLQSDLEEIVEYLDDMHIF